MKRTSILVLACLLLSFSSQAQLRSFGKKLKNAAQKALDENAGDILVEEGENLAKNQLDKKQAEYDTTTFSYAIAFLDKAESFENRQDGEQLVRAAGVIMPNESNDLDNARDLYDRGRALYNVRNYSLGEKHLAAATIAYVALGETDHPVFFKSVGTLGLLFNNMGRYDLADTANAFALQGWEKTYGTGSRGYAAEYNNKAVIAFNKGEYNEAESLFTKALRLTEVAEGSESVPFAIANNNLGILYQHMGRSDDALEKLNTCLAIAEEQLREKSGTYIQLMTNKALVLQENGQYQEAEDTYKKAIDLQTSRLKLNRKSDPDYAHLLNNLASLYLVTGKTDEVESLLKESLEIYVTKFGENHPSTSAAKADLGNFYRSQGQLTEAQSLLLAAFDDRKKSLGATHPVTVQSEEDLATLQWLQGDISTAQEHFSRVMDYSLSFINEFFPPMSEVEKTKYWEKMKNRFYTFYNFALANYEGEPSLLDDMIQYRLMTKGILLSSTSKIKRTILGSGDEDLISLYYQWQDQKRTLASYYSLSNEEMTQQGINLDSLEGAANESERQLSARSSAFADAFVPKNVDYRDITSLLSAEEAIVEMVHIPDFQNAFTGSYKYAGIILKRDATPAVVVLDNGDQLDKRYYSYYKNVIKNKLADEHTYDQYWARLSGPVSNSSTIYFSPDGVFNQINLNTLQGPDGQYLIQEKTFRIIGNPRDMLETTPSSSASKDAFLLGFPTYGSKDISPLPGTEVELQKVKSTLVAGNYKVNDVSQLQASESSVKAVRSPRVVHIATHGYFLEDVQKTGSVFGVQVEYAKNNPLLRSGLMLAGASTSQRASSFSADEDGMLTAYEASQLQLDGTDLVILSACETGKGDIKSGEGVYGLQRAFSIAGADKVVMSLWKVDDAATQELMSLFYGQWIQSGEELSTAFRNAQLQLMEKYPEPYYWGAFIAIGQ